MQTLKSSKKNFTESMSHNKRKLSLFLNILKFIFKNKLNFNNVINLY